MWNLVRGLRERGVTIILTTHYIEEAEEMADRIGVINKGELIICEEKAKLMQKLGKRQLTLNLQEPLAAIPEALGDWSLALKAKGNQLEYTYDSPRRAAGRHLARCCGAWASWASGSRICTPRRARWRTSSSTWSTIAAGTGRGRGHEQRHDHRERGRRGGDGQPAQRQRPGPGVQPPRRLGHLPLRDGPVRPDGAPEHRHPGGDHVAVLRGVRVGHRLAHVQRRGRALRRLHRARV